LLQGQVSVCFFREVIYYLEGHMQVGCFRGHKVVRYCNNSVPFFSIY